MNTLLRLSLIQRGVATLQMSLEFGIEVCPHSRRTGAAPLSHFSTSGTQHPV